MGGVAKSPVEYDLLAGLRLGEVQDTLWHRDSDHLFKTQSLGAKLNGGVVGVSRSTRLVFDGHDRRGSLSRVGELELYDVALADQAEALAPYGQGAFDADSLLGSGQRLVGPLVRRCATNGEDVLIPDALEVDQTTLARTVAPVLESADRDEKLLGYPMSRIKVTPLGKSASSIPIS